MDGTAEKKGHGQSPFGRRNWKRRYFSLDDTYFTYWTRMGGKKKGFAQSSAIRLPTREESLPFYFLSFHIDNRKFTLRFKEQEERDQWFEVLETISLGKPIADCPFISQRVPQDPLAIFEAKEESKKRQSSLAIRISQRLR